MSGLKIELEELMCGNMAELIVQFSNGPHHGQICMVDRVDYDFLDIEDDIHSKNYIQIINSWSKRNIKIVGISINQVSSFNIYLKKNLKKLEGHLKYENKNSFELTNINNNIVKKIVK